MGPHHIAVLGGGLTGLSSAYHLSHRFPSALITLIERSSRVGGWAESERVVLKDPKDGSEASILLEGGPRTLRPSAKSVLELVTRLDLLDSVIAIPGASPASKNKFMQIPGQRGLTSIPTTIMGLLRSPFGSSITKALAKDALTFSNRADLTDESFNAFLCRRFGHEFAETIGSAMVHGIFATDSRKLSVRSAFPVLWEAEEHGWGSVTRGFMRKRNEEDVEQSHYISKPVQKAMEGASVFSFRDGMDTVARAVEGHLSKLKNVKILKNTDITSLGVSITDKSIEITTTSPDLPQLRPTHVVSALPLYALHNILSPNSTLPHLTANPSSTVTVYNLIFRTDTPTPIHPTGFGYLIPRPPGGYTHPEANSEGILGCVFDSCALGAQDHMPGPTRYTKMTVMAGGPYMAGSAYQGGPPALDAVLRALAGHLDWPTVYEPVFSRVRENRECIPVPAPGHLERMAELKRALLGEEWRGRMEIVGAGVGGVSVGDCVEAGRWVGEKWGPSAEQDEDEDEGDDE
ncbi:hypothetical protein BD626DRAFT_631469 [Schizophyllum amplum]|uniref:Protoporphyrinogen oxidase n=1 Tax=Schizophyllum amplum TaxID=97359 RepID=A0A550CAL1_9AGAR|nr:hypothetical protein BD626DRAFT_631469 [Auriculariopsis ampla]